MEGGKKERKEWEKQARMPLTQLRNIEGRISLLGKVINAV